MVELHNLWRSAEKIHKPRGLIHIEMGDITRFSLSDTRAGITWPAKGRPGYYVLIGQASEENVRGKRPLIFLDEKEDDSLLDLFDQLVHNCLRLYCMDVYADIVPFVKGASPGGFEDLYSNFLKENNINGPHLHPAPYRGPDQFQAGLSFIRRRLNEGALELPDGSIVKEQLGRIPKGDLGEHPGIEFYAVNALCYIVGSYEREGGAGKRMTPTDVERLKAMYGGPGRKGRGPLEIE